MGAGKRVLVGWAPTGGPSGMSTHGGPEGMGASEVVSGGWVLVRES